MINGQYTGDYKFAMSSYLPDGTFTDLYARRNIISGPYDYYDPGTYSYPNKADPFRGYDMDQIY